MASLEVYQVYIIGLLPGIEKPVVQRPSRRTDQASLDQLLVEKRANTGMLGRGISLGLSSSFTGLSPLALRFG